MVAYKYDVSLSIHFYVFAHEVFARKYCGSFRSPKSYNLCLECLRLPQVKMLWQRFCHSGKRGPGNETLKKRKEQTVFCDRFQPLAGPSNNENPFLFQNKTRKPAFCPAFAPPLPRFCTKKSHLTHLTWSMIYTKWSNFIGCYAKQRIVIGRQKSRHCQTWLERRSSLNENLQRKENWTAKSTNPEENGGKIKSVFVIGAALWAKKFGRCLENYGSWKNTLGKLVVTVNLEAIWFEFWMKGA